MTQAQAISAAGKIAGHGACDSVGIIPPLAPSTQWAVQFKITGHPAVYRVARSIARQTHAEVSNICGNDVTIC